MFEAIAAELQRLQDAPTDAAALAARRLTARCRTGHVEAAGEGLSVQVNVRKPFLSPEWAEEIERAVVDAVKGGA